MMFKWIFTTCLFALVLGVLSEQAAWGQYRGRDSGGSDRDREEMRRRFEAMRSRFGGDREEMRRRFEEMRRSGGGPGGGDRRGSSRGGDDRGGFRGFSRGGDSRGRGGDDRRSSDRVEYYVPQEHTPINLELPDRYLDGDIDEDGQISLLEWRQWKPREIALFLRMDTNNDGFLTARELAVAEKLGTANSSSESEDNLSATTQSGSPSTSNSRNSDADGNRSSETEEDGPKPSEAEARYVFGALDKNRDGSLSAEEWKASKSVREAFEKSEIQFSPPADLDAFLDIYPYERLLPYMRLPSSNR